MLQIYCSGQPPDYVLRDAKNTSKFFKCIGSLQNIESSESSKNGRSVYQTLTVEEYEAVSLICYSFFCSIFLQHEQCGISSIPFLFFGFFFEYYMFIVVSLVPVQRELKKPSIGKEYFNQLNLEAIVTNYPYRKNLPKEDILKG